jgi:hypothetical protein
VPQRTERIPHRHVCAVPQLTHEFNNLDAFLSELLHAQNSADDAMFADACAALQAQADGLKADEEAIQTVVTDAATAASSLDHRLHGYITQALGFIAKL